MESVKTPVEPIQTQVFGEPVFEFVAAGVEGLDVGHMGRDGKGEVSWEGGLGFS